MDEENFTPGRKKGYCKICKENVIFVQCYEPKDKWVCIKCPYVTRKEKIKLQDIEPVKNSYFYIRRKVFG